MRLFHPLRYKRIDPRCQLLDRCCIDQRRHRGFDREGLLNLGKDARCEQESPPRSSYRSAMPTRPIPSALRQISSSLCSVGVRGATSTPSGNCGHSTIVPGTLEWLPLDARHYAASAPAPRPLGVYANLNRMLEMRQAPAFFAAIGFSSRGVEPNCGCTLARSVALRNSREKSPACWDEMAAGRLSGSGNRQQVARSEMR